MEYTGNQENWESCIELVADNHLNLQGIYETTKSFHLLLFSLVNIHNIHMFKLYAKVVSEILYF